MQLINLPVAANDFQKCVKTYLKSKDCPNKELDDEFWRLVRTMTFENGKLSQGCKLYQVMKKYADSHQFQEQSLVWELSFQEESEQNLKAIILHLIKLRSGKNKSIRAGSKYDDYTAAMDSSKNFLRQIKHKLNSSGFSDDIMEQFEKYQIQWMDILTEKIAAYKQAKKPLDDDFDLFIFEWRNAIKAVVRDLSGGMMYAEKESG